MNESLLPKKSDGLELIDGAYPYAHSPTGWLIRAYVKFLNADEGNQEASTGLKYVVELLKNRKDATRALVSESQRTGMHDPMLRWNLLHALGDLEDAEAAKFLTETAAAPLPAVENKGCHGPLDAEILVRTMAIEALHKTLKVHPQQSELMLTLVGGRLITPLRVEAVKAALALGLGERLKEVLPKEDHWMLDLKKAAFEELRVEHEQIQTPTSERLFRAPSLDANFGKPQSTCCDKHKNH